MIRMMNTPDDFTGPVNIGNQGEFSMNELAKIVIRLTNSSSKIVYRPLPGDDPKQRKPDITFGQREIRWVGTYGLFGGRIKENNIIL